MKERNFKGVWIPAEIWLDDRLTMLEKGIFIEINTLDMSEKGCYASNRHIAEFCCCSERKVSETVSKLAELGYIRRQAFDGRQRKLKSNLQSSMEERAGQTGKNCGAEAQNLQESNTDKNTDRNTDKNKIQDLRTGRAWENREKKGEKGNGIYHRKNGSDPTEGRADSKHDIHWGVEC